MKTRSFAGRQLYVLCVLICGTATAQKAQNETDIIDLYRMIMQHEPVRQENDVVKDKNAHFSVLPAVGYTLETGFAVLASANALYYTSKDSGTFASTASSSIASTQYRQFIFPLQTYTWTKDNKYNIVTDWRFVKYPQYTYGLGGHTQTNDGYQIDYSNIHLYQTVMRLITKKLYGGIGYNFDYYWNIKEVDPPSKKLSDFEYYGLSPKVKASGFTFNALLDNRDNPIDPQEGSYARLIYRTNMTMLGSDANWQSLIIDMRHYIDLSGRKKNVLAFWMYDWITTSGTPPYLMLPSIGWDPSNNTGRGYILGRFRGRNMLYGETEYRFEITNNGLIGGVAFINACSVSEPVTNRFETIAPALGTGIRIKVNKFSRTNVAIDYGIGLNRSQVFFVNLGEVF